VPFLSWLSLPKLPGEVGIFRTNTHSLDESSNSDHPQGAMSKYTLKRALKCRRNEETLSTDYRDVTSAQSAVRSRPDLELNLRAFP
jgi:hypothetical protein